MPGLLEAVLSGLGQQAQAAQSSQERNREEALALLQAGFVPQDSPLAAQIGQGVEQPASAPTDEVTIGEPSKIEHLDQLLRQSFLPEQPLDASGFVPSTTNPQVVARRGQDTQVAISEADRASREQIAQLDEAGRAARAEAANDIAREANRLQGLRVEGEAASREGNQFIAKERLKIDQANLSLKVQDVMQKHIEAMAKLEAEQQAKGADFYRDPGNLADGLEDIDRARDNYVGEFAAILGVDLPGLISLWNPRVAATMEGFKRQKMNLIQLSEGRQSDDAATAPTSKNAAINRNRDILSKQSDTPIIGNPQASQFDFSNGLFPEPGDSATAPPVANLEDVIQGQTRPVISRSDR